MDVVNGDQPLLAVATNSEQDCQLRSTRTALSDTHESYCCNMCKRARRNSTSDSSQSAITPSVAGNRYDVDGMLQGLDLDAQLGSLITLMTCIEHSSLSTSERSEQDQLGELMLLDKCQTIIMNLLMNDKPHDDDGRETAIKKLVVLKKKGIASLFISVVLTSIYLDHGMLSEAEQEILSMNVVKHVNPVMYDHRRRLHADLFGKQHKYADSAIRYLTIKSYPECMLRVCVEKGTIMALLSPPGQTSRRLLEMAAFSGYLPDRWHPVITKLRSCHLIDVASTECKQLLESVQPHEYRRQVAETFKYSNVQAASRIYEAITLQRLTEAIGSETVNETETICASMIRKDMLGAEACIDQLQGIVYFDTSCEAMTATERYRRVDDQIRQVCDKLMDISALIQKKQNKKKQLDTITESVQ